ncbi:MAG TPA: SPFH domain-containing protein [Methanomicrobiales archaeon]|nr:SPFH domain-containing protein [Methanomicrobiales archaeon]
MATVSETGNSGMAMAVAIVVGVVVYFATLEPLWAAAAAIVIGYVVMGIRIVRPTHRVLIEFLGKYQKYGNPGLYWILPGIQKLYAVNITEKLVNADRQEIITSDNLNAFVDAQIYFKVKIDEESVKASQYNVFNYEDQIVALARTTLRNIIGGMTLKTANSERNTINLNLAEALTKETAAWGIQIVRAELKEIQPPPDVQETMNRVVKALNEKTAAIDFATATETNADGQRRAAIKQAEGVRQATILEAQGKAEAIRLVNEAAKQYFQGTAITLRQLEVAENALSTNTKIIVPAGQSVVNVIGGLLGIEAGDQSKPGGSNPVKSLWMPPGQ